jgi:hypothetical protein
MMKQKHRRHTSQGVENRFSSGTNLQQSQKTDPSKLVTERNTEL